MNVRYLNFEALLLRFICFHRETQRSPNERVGGMKKSGIPEFLQCFKQTGKSKRTDELLKGGMEMIHRENGRIEFETRQPIRYTRFHTLAPLQDGSTQQLHNIPNGRMVVRQRRVEENMALVIQVLHITHPFHRDMIQNGDDFNRTKAKQGEITQNSLHANSFHRPPYSDPYNPLRATETHTQIVSTCCTFSKRSAGPTARLCPPFPAISLRTAAKPSSVRMAALSRWPPSSSARIPTAPACNSAESAV